MMNRMVASLLKVISTGIQDERIQPPKGQIGALTTVFIRAGRYSTQWSRIDFDTRPDFGSTCVARLPTQGELIGRVFLVCQMPDIKTPQDRAQNSSGLTFVGPHFGWTNALGHVIINQAQIHIGGVLMDTIPGQLMEICLLYTSPSPRDRQKSRMPSSA